jgi:hypothetical protein
MLAASLSLDTFLKGVAAYLKRFSYANATTDDLWAALSGASGVDVGEFMQAWTRKIGVREVYRLFFFFFYFFFYFFFRQFSRLISSLIILTFS